MTSAAPDSERPRAGGDAAATVDDELIGTVSHALRGPLNAMAGWLHILREAIPDSPANDKALRGLEAAIAQQLNLVGQLHEFARLSAGKVRLDAAPVRLRGVIAEALASASADAGARDVRLSFAGGSGVDAVVLGEAERLRLALHHLLINAARATPRGGEVAIELGCKDDHAEMVVRDVGRGIPADALATIFERDPHRRSSGGLGLGLSIARLIAELHGGRVSAESEGEGKGSAFTISLPLANHSA